jgi:heme/copper-type cytochrome/quinol oxidase subunit 4
MATADRVKEEIGLLKLFLAALIAIDVSLIAWLAQNYTRANRLLVLAAVATTLMIAAAAVWVSRLMYRASNGWKTFNLWYGLL